MELDIKQIAENLLKDLDSEATLRKGMRLGVIALYERIQQAADEISKPSGETPSGEQQASPVDKAPGAANS